MNRRKLLRYLRSHPQVLDRDPIKNAPYLDEKDIPQDHAEQKPREKSRTRYAIMGAVAGALAMFVFMLSPVGNAVSEYVYNNIEVYWNDDKTAFNYLHQSNVGKAPINDGTYEFKSFEEYDEVFPDLQIARNDIAELSKLTIDTNQFMTSVVSYYNYEGEDFFITQSIEYVETSSGGSIILTDGAVPVELTFHHGKISAYGGYEHGHANISAFAENCEFCFTADNMPLETVSMLVEKTYIK